MKTVFTPLVWHARLPLAKLRLAFPCRTCLLQAFGSRHAGYSTLVGTCIKMNHARDHSSNDNATLNSRLDVHSEERGRGLAVPLAVSFNFACQLVGLHHESYEARRMQPTHGE